MAVGSAERAVKGGGRKLDVCCLCHPLLARTPPFDAHPDPAAAALTIQQIVDRAGGQQATAALGQPAVVHQTAPRGQQVDQPQLQALELQVCDACHTNCQGRAPRLRPQPGQGCCLIGGHHEGRYDSLGGRVGPPAARIKLRCEGMHQEVWHGIASR